MRDLYTTMDKGNTVPPIIMLQVLHTAFPRFAERGEGGGYKQQDANECWVEILRMLQVTPSMKLFINFTNNITHRPRLQLQRGLPRQMLLSSFLVLSAAVRRSVSRSGSFLKL